MQLLTDFCCALKLSIMPDREGEREKERELEREREGESRVLRRVVCAQAASADIVQILAATLDVIANMCSVHTRSTDSNSVCVCVCACVLESRKQEGSYDKEVILCAANFLTYRKLS